MVALGAQAVVDQISGHILRQGGPASAWYVGITADVEQRVFADHQVPKKDHWRIHRQAVSSDAARAAEKALLDWGCDGGGGGGNVGAIYVYGYLKTASTKP